MKIPRKPRALGRYIAVVLVSMLEYARFQYFRLKWLPDLRQNYICLLAVPIEHSASIFIQRYTDEWSVMGAINRDN